jgi:succinate dehydrogenase/fumarate reductase cytochrome b subunit
MKILHYYSGITISMFIGFHLLNHLLVLRSEDHHVRFMQTLRNIYRKKIIEILLLTGILIQIVSGITLVIFKWNKTENYFDVIQIISGLYMVFFLTVHINAVMIGRYKLKIDTNLYYGAGVMNMWPHKLFYIPYYSLAILSFFFHIACVHRIKMSKLVSTPAATTQSFIVMGIGVIITLLTIGKMSRLKFSNRKIVKTESSDQHNYLL